MRVDVLYGRMGKRARGRVDLLGSALLLIPFCLLGIWSSWPFVRNSWAVLEESPDPGGLWRYPLKAVVPVAFVLLLLQGLSELRRSYRRMRGLEDGANGPDSGGNGLEPSGDEVRA